jgi:hypothetical protein
MKTIKSIFLIMLVSIVSFVQAQNALKVTDFVDGKTLLQHAQQIDAEAMNLTKPIYKPGMTEAAFVSELQKDIPPEAASFKPLFTPYFKYVYSLHQRGFTENQVKGTTTGIEFTAMCTDLYRWNTNNPGIIPDAVDFPWRKIQHYLELTLLIIRVIIGI